MADNISTFNPRKMEPEDWEGIKWEVHRLYIKEDNTIQMVQAQLEAIHGFHACISIWQRKIRTEWNFRKNFSRTVMYGIVAVAEERAREGKKTEFFCEGAPMAQAKIDNFIRKHCRGSAPPLNFALPSYIRYGTPSPSNEDDPMQGISYDEANVSLSVSPNAPSSSLDHACSLCSLEWEIGPDEIDRVKLPDEPEFAFISSIDRWLEDKNLPRTYFKMCWESETPDDIELQDDQSVSRAFEEHSIPNEEYNVRPNIADNFPRHFADYPSLNLELEDNVYDEAVIKNLSTLSRKLGQFLHQDMEFAPEALAVRFKLADALIQIGKFEEAEFHCRALEAIEVQVGVATQLGTIFARTARLEESTMWLFIALTTFIIDFAKNSLKQNLQLSDRIYPLFVEVLFQSKEDWQSLALILKNMMSTLEGLRSDGDLLRAWPELFIHGFGLAHDCTTLNLIDPARYMYEHLLEPSSLYLKGHQLFEKAKAHQVYGALLGRAKEWSSSAEQLLQSCESVMKTGQYTYQHVAFLISALENIRPHLPHDIDGPIPKIKEIEAMLDDMMSHVMNSDNGFSDHAAGDYLQSNLFGLRYTASRPEMSLQLRLTLPVRSTISSLEAAGAKSISSKILPVNGSVRASKKSSSSGQMSWSADGSHENGQTWPTGEWDEYAGIQAFCDM